MQNIPCEVRAYLRFSIFRLQFLHLKQVAQNAWSPVRIAKSSILLLHALQLYVQLLQMREPSPRRSRFASESRRVPQVLHRKQFKCHRLPAVDLLERLKIEVKEVMFMLSRVLQMKEGEKGDDIAYRKDFTYQVRMLSPLRESSKSCSASQILPSLNMRKNLHLHILCTDMLCRRHP